MFKSGNSQAVRLPKDFRFAVEEVEVSREGDAVILRPEAECHRPLGFASSGRGARFSPDFMAEGREQSDEQARPALDRAFR
ncbi:antitoxin VapB [Bradyrhizobium sp. CIR18]|uniref:antitoxin n=1 Tax=Bradyrhizobium sp. CIR18 TaxID=2663839 RepID=UPI0017F82EEB|nr:type II toxin-antitoxin system VapB family antitoxin [Bradyrhizobium sp. CIR18]MBB4364837.1 antitoxin VapB [Bradyrhizobium sp. CIR18]